MANTDKKNVLPDLAAFEELKRKTEALEKELAAERAKAASGFGLEISEKGCVVIRLGSGYPLSVYGDKLDVLIANFDKVRAFAEENKGRIKRHAEKA